MSSHAKTSKQADALNPVKRVIVNQKINVSQLSPEIESYTPSMEFDRITDTVGRLMGAKATKKDEVISIVFEIDSPIQFVYINPHTLRRTQIVTIKNMHKLIGNVSEFYGVSPNNRYVLFNTYRNESGIQRYIVVDLHLKTFYDLDQLIADKNHIYNQGEIFRSSRDAHSQALDESFFRPIEAGFRDDNGVYLKTVAFNTETPTDMDNYVEVNFAPIDAIIKRRQQNIAYNPKVTRKFIPDTYYIKRSHERYFMQGSKVKTWTFSKPNVVVSEVVPEFKTKQLLITDRDSNKPIAILDAQKEIYPSHIYFDSLNKRTFVFNGSSRNQMMIWDYYPE